MNQYVFSSFLALILSGMGLSSLILGITNHVQNRESRSSSQMLGLMACTFLWDSGYAWMSLCFDSKFAYVPRAIALLAVCVYCLFLVGYIAALVKFPQKKLIPFYVIFGISAIASWFKIIQVSAVEFRSTPWGYWYTSTMSWGRILQFFSVLFATIVFYYILFYGLRRATLSRDKYIFKGYIWFGPILYSGYIVDTLIPSIYDVPAFPGSAICAFLATLLLYRLSKSYKAFGISKNNISEYVFKDVDIPVIITDYRKKIALYNDCVIDYFECTDEELENVSLNDFLANKKVKSFDLEANKDGAEVVSFVSESRGNVIFKFADNNIFDRFNELMYTISFVQDLTLERTRMEEIENTRRAAEDANMAKSNFLANMSHEIRTPMNAIIGMSEIIMHNNPSNEIAKDVGEIRNAANNLLGIINDILDISKIEAGKYEIMPEDYYFSSLINDICTIIRVRVQESKTRFNIEIDPSVPEILIGDQTRVRQILLNILGNAVKFTKEGSITFKVYWNNEWKSPEIYFDVIDTGIGIKEEDIDRIFGAFNQVDTRRNRSIQGTGLGLAISKELAKIMGGDITVESKYGEGSTFHISICQSIDKYTEVGEKKTNAIINATYTNALEFEEKEKISKPDAKVLIVDDVEINLMIAKRLLKKYDINADTAISGMKAIEMATNKDYDLIFMDHMMPEMDGIDTTRAIRKLPNDKYANVPIVALTANALNEARELFVKEGLQDFLAKPIETKNLEEIIIRWL